VRPSTRPTQFHSPRTHHVHRALTPPPPTTPDHYACHRHHWPSQVPPPTSRLKEETKLVEGCCPLAHAPLGTLAAGPPGYRWHHLGSSTELPPPLARLHTTDATRPPPPAHLHNIGVAQPPPLALLHTADLLHQPASMPAGLHPTPPPPPPPRWIVFI
jgi:hypothetical protein